MRPVALAGLSEAQPDREGRIAHSDRTRRTEGRHLQPFDLREGDRRERRICGCAEAVPAGADHSIAAIYEHLAIADIRAAADVLRPVYDETQGRDGYISLECSPYLANDTEATVAEALRLWAAVGRPNLMVKVPATPAGIPAIRALIGRGLNINVTLLFSVERLRAGGRSLYRRARGFGAAGGDVSKIGSVASIFVSRIDTRGRQAAGQARRQAAADRLRGKVGDRQREAGLRSL